MNTATSLGAVVDQLGKVKAEIADLKEKEDDLKTDLIASSEKAVEGSLFRATISSSTRATTDYKGILAEIMAGGRVSLKTYNELVEKHTTVGNEIFTVRVVSR